MHKYSLRLALLLASPMMLAQATQPAATISARDLADIFYEDAANALPQQDATPENNTTHVKQAVSGKLQRRTQTGLHPNTATNPSHQSAHPETRRIGLKYWILHERNQEIREVSAQAAFITGDRIRLQIESNVDGYLYVLAKGSSGKQTMLFPDARINGGRNDVQRGMIYSVPSTDWFEFYDRPGQESLLIAVTRHPAQLFQFSQPPTNNEPGAVITALNVLQGSVQGRDLAFSEDKGHSDPNSAHSSPSTIVMNLNRDNNEIVFTELTLKHK